MQVASKQAITDAPPLFQSQPDPEDSRTLYQFHSERLRAVLLCQHGSWPCLERRASRRVDAWAGHGNRLRLRIVDRIVDEEVMDAYFGRVNQPFGKRPFSLIFKSMTGV